MALPNMTPSFAGQVNGSGDARALFLKVYGGEVLTAFETKNVALARTTVRTIDSGKSAQFPATWKTTAAYHTPGNMIDGNVIKNNERVIVIDDMLISPVFIARIDEAMSHFDVRAPYTRECGIALGTTLDKNILQVGVLAARASATVSGGNGGTAIVAATAKTNADALIGAAFDAAQALDEKDVPEEGRSIYLLPDQYYQLVNSGSKLIHRDYNDGSNGSVAKGEVFMVAGLEIVKTNNLPKTNINSGVTKYQGDFTNTAALVMHRSAVGTLKLLDLTVESAYLIDRQGTLVVAKLAVGHDILRPESAVEISTS